MKAVEVNILEQKLLVKSEDGEEHVKKIADYLNSKIEEVKQKSKAVSTLNVALLAAMNIADDYLETKEKLIKLEGRSKKLSELIDRRVD
ncbi:MAG: cell division protein ZapA [Deltaproteobacteria bacterium]|nr:cell division protein ZapA [Deltaproteobacteria bacterium]MBI3754575.1 cell division protein ZapA [Deltaproteobacteria bacterium]